MKKQNKRSIVNRFETKFKWFGYLLQVWELIDLIREYFL